MIGGFLSAARAEGLNLLAAVRAFDVGHVLDEPEHCYLHHLRHPHGFAHDHLDEVLGGGDDDDALNREGLEDGQRDVTGSRRHIHEQEVNITPVALSPELS